MSSGKTGQIISDMTLPHEGTPHGVPYCYVWLEGPVIGRGNDASGFTALTAWGQLYHDADSVPAVNTRVQIRNIRAYILSRRTRRWQVVQDTLLVDGACYYEDFAENISIDTDTRTEADGSLSISLPEGYNYHFWPVTGRAEIDPGDLAAVYATVEARLVVDDPNQPDDRDSARYLLSMGADYWVDQTACWSEDGDTNQAVGIGRFRYVRSRWQKFHMITLNEEEVRRNPPPAKGD